MTLPRHFVIAGVNGKFGRVVARKLHGASLSVSGIDRQPEPCENHLEQYVCGNVCQPSDQVVAALRQAEALLLCLPEQTIVDALPSLLELIPPDALVMDVASVKSHVAGVLKGQRFAGEYLSMHPMFGPMDDFSGRNVAVVALQSGPKSGAFVEMLKKWGAQLTEVTAEQHDRAAAWLQAGTHVMLLAWAGAAQHVGIPIDTLLLLQTPLSTTLTALACRTLAAGADLERELQVSNPYALHVRRFLQLELRRLSEAIERDDAKTLQEQFERLRSLFGERSDEYQTLASKIIDALIMNDQE